MDFRTFARIITFRWKIVVAAILACLVGAATITALQPKTYQASATILMTLSGAESVTESTRPPRYRSSGCRRTPRSREVALRRTWIGQLNLAMTADQLVDHTKVTYTPESLMFQITVSDSDRQRVAALAGAVADQFAAYVPEVEPTVGGDHPAPFAYAVVVERPTVAEYPVSPVPTRNLALGLVAGVLLGIASALIRNAMDRTVRTREALEQASGVPTLGELPRRKRTTAMHELGELPHQKGTPGTRSPGLYEESIRGLRARLISPGGPKPRSLLLTGSTSGEGVTTSALQLALRSPGWRARGAGRG